MKRILLASVSMKAIDRMLNKGTYRHRTDHWNTQSSYAQTTAHTHYHIRHLLYKVAPNLRTSEPKVKA